MIWVSSSLFKKNSFSCHPTAATTQQYQEFMFLSGKLFFVAGFQVLKTYITRHDTYLYHSCRSTNIAPKKRKRNGRGQPGNGPFFPDAFFCSNARCRTSYVRRSQVNEKKSQYERKGKNQWIGQYRCSRRFQEAINYWTPDAECRCRIPFGR